MAEGFVYKGQVHDLGFIFWEVEGGILKNDQESNGAPKLTLTRR